MQISEEIKNRKLSISKKKNFEKIIDANKSKPKANLCKISKYIHIVIFQYLEIKELFRVSAACRSLLKSS